VLASDGSHYYANMGEGRPFPVVASVTEMVDGWRRVRALASNERHVVPGHDPLVMRRYRAPSPALEGIAVRLDADPAG
jgi:glyoxylase-like metal-dependent hydrolase (beta-lactamase superfamily II)